MSQQVIKLSTNAAERIKEIMSSAEKNALGELEFLLNLEVVQECLM